MSILEGDIFSALAPTCNHKPKEFIGISIKGIKGLVHSGLDKNARKMRTLLGEHIPSGMVKILDNGEVSIGDGYSDTEVENFLIELAAAFDPRNKYNKEQFLLASQWRDPPYADDQILYPRVLCSALGLPSYKIVVTGFRVTKKNEIEVLSCLRANADPEGPDVLLDYCFGGGKDALYTTLENLIKEAEEELGDEACSFIKKCPDRIVPLGDIYTARQFNAKFIQGHVDTFCFDFTGYDGPFEPNTEALEDTVGFDWRPLQDLLSAPKELKYDYPVALILFADFLARSQKIEYPAWMDPNSMEAFKRTIQTKPAISGTAMFSQRSQASFAPREATKAPQFG